MSIFQAMLLGLIQGVTEFIPVSSSTHLMIAQRLMGLKAPLLFFDIAVHLGTLISIAIYFFKELAHIVRDSIYALTYVLRKKPREDIDAIVPYARWGLGILVVSIPTGFIGFFFKDWLESLFDSGAGLGFGLLGTSLLLASTLFLKKGEKEIKKTTLFDFFLIGLMQGFAIIPGISRLGATLVSGLFLGLKPEIAFRFSFLISIPAILGAAILQLRKGFQMTPEVWIATGIGFLVSAVVGYLALVLVAGILKKGKVYGFGLYTFVLGLAILFLT